MVSKPFARGTRGKLVRLKGRVTMVLPPEYLDHIYPSQVRSFKIKTTQTWIGYHEGRSLNTGRRFGHPLHTVLFENDIMLVDLHLSNSSSSILIRVSLTTTDQLTVSIPCLQSIGIFLRGSNLVPSPKPRARMDGVFAAFRSVLPPSHTKMPWVGIGDL
jgi:hypothetical protein